MLKADISTDKCTLGVTIAKRLNKLKPESASIKVMKSHNVTENYACY